MASRRRHFGSVRKLPSGRWQASYWHEVTRHTASWTFKAKADALAWLATTEADIRRGVWVDPAGGRLLFGPYANAWLDQRHELRPRTVELYRSLLKRDLLPTFAQVPLAEITTAAVRAWHAGIARDRPTTAAKAYRLLRSIRRAHGLEPLRDQRGRPGARPRAARALHRGGASHRRAAGGRYRALVLTAAFSGLRSGELAALERHHVDLVHRTISAERQAQTVVGRGRVLGPPKSAAGARTSAIPAELVGVLDRHLATWVGADPASLVFTSDKGGPIRTQHWSRRFRTAAEAVGETDLHFHDLRHLAGTLAAATGASTRELMARLGHSTPRAALIYQHATEESDHQIAAGIDDILEAARGAPTGSVVRIDRSASRT
jgi:integrase